MIFDLDSDEASRAALATNLGQAMSPLERRVFEDGECRLRPLADPRGDDVYVVQSLHGDALQSPHDKLVALCMFVATLLDHGAARVTAVVPYLAYARMDRRTRAFDPLGQRYVAQMIEAMGAAQVIVLEAHDVPALENAFRCPCVHVEAHVAFDDVAVSCTQAPLVIASPDAGGVKRALLWREHLEAHLRRDVGFAMLAKRRRDAALGGDDRVAGKVGGATVLVLDDLICTGRTLVRAAHALKREGASRIVACAAHGLFVEGADQILGDPAIDAVVVGDSVRPFRVAASSPLHGKLTVVSCAPLLARAIRDSHAAWRR